MCSLSGGFLSESDGGLREEHFGLEGMFWKSCLLMKKI